MFNTNILANIQNIFSMAKKNFIGIRLSDENLKFLKETSMKLGIHHKLSKELPNINATIELMINHYKKTKELRSHE